MINACSSNLLAPRHGPEPAAQGLHCKLAAVIDRPLSIVLFIPAFLFEHYIFIGRIR